MPVSCVFKLNRQVSSDLTCTGFGSIEAYSGRGVGRDNPDAVSLESVGPIPPGRYYLIDRQAGGRLGWLRDWWTDLVIGSDHTQWFTLWNPKTGDSTIVNGVKRESFRLHPNGVSGTSMGCITVVDKKAFEKLKRFIRSSPPTISIPGTSYKAYGVVEVQ
ncbi:DUF2778 domain-containing protein [Caballeronia sp. LZ032]|uniref:DUF2778 domain-containing protein n=1 Tax=Caballeronia sp. LZ032 TaxID=3038565 RepID=UPI00285DB42D|nr:DUF2778 domain-containing protein [Caballeronia sp. LZ032]MDR5882158.1 DUF2778 domain-containing protein [Caballeronia sp. LZ032]